MGFKPPNSNRELLTTSCPGEDGCLSRARTAVHVQNPGARPESRFSPELVGPGMRGTGVFFSFTKRVQCNSGYTDSVTRVTESVTRVTESEKLTMSLSCSSSLQTVGRG